MHGIDQRTNTALLLVLTHGDTGFLVYPWARLPVFSLIGFLSAVYPFKLPISWLDLTHRSARGRGGEAPRQTYGTMRSKFKNRGNVDAVLSESIAQISQPSNCHWNQMKPDNRSCKDGNVLLNADIHLTDDLASPLQRQ